MSNRTDKSTQKKQENMAKSKEEFLDHFAKSLALVASACRKTGISRQTFYRWYDNDDDFRQKVDDVRELAKDSVEASIFDKIRNGDTTMMIFYAKTRMKDRGYVERREIVGKNGAPLIGGHDIDVDKLTEEQKEVLRQIGNDMLDKTE